LAGSKEIPKVKKRGKSVNKKGIFVVIFFGGILLTSTIMFALPPPPPTMSEDDIESDITKTGTPMDNFPDDQRATFCGVEDAKSNSYVTEYKIPTVCTQPLAIKVVPDGNVWFVESNTGNIAKFNPTSEQFTEFENSFWPEHGRTMSWGMDYSPDGSLWYTDGTFDSLWRFSIITETYDGISYPAAVTGSLPQRLEIDGSNVFVNDFTGGKITIFDLTQNTDDITYTSVLNPIPEAFTGDMTIDSDNNLWYTNWVVDSTGFLVKLNLEDYQNDVSIIDTETTLENYIEAFDFPHDLNTANGLVVDQNGDAWIVDTSSSFFFRFDPTTEEFTKYITTTPPLSTYGNVTGIIKSPISRPYWIDTDNLGNLVFNEQTSNQIAVFNVKNESLIEYMVPSKNPNWADCDLESSSNCGVAQIFGFDITDGAIWFTEWAENNIGVVDTTKSLPFNINTDKETLLLKKGESGETTLTIVYSNISDSVNSEIKTSHTASTTTNFSDLLISTSRNPPQGNTEEVTITIQASETSLAGNYKVLLGIGNNEVTVSQYVDVIIES
jgi:virginiamycin B lyase